MTWDLVLLCFGLTLVTGHSLRQISKEFQAFTALCPLSKRAVLEVKGLQGTARRRKERKKRNSCGSLLYRKVYEFAGFTWICALQL